MKKKTYTFRAIPDVCVRCPSRSECSKPGRLRCIRWEQRFTEIWNETVFQLRELTGLEVEDDGHCE